MPIYAYRCAACGHAQDVLQKISDPVLTKCPVCGADAFQKQITAAGFQLKGSGWYVTDFRGNSGGSKSPDGTAKPADAAPSGDAKTGDTKPADAKPAADSKASAPAAAPAPAPAPSPSPSPSSSSGS